MTFVIDNYSPLCLKTSNTILYLNVLDIICGRGSALDLCLTRRVVVVKGVPINIVPGPCASSALYVYLVVLGMSIKMSFMHV